jgi:hypothetical protein
MIPFTFTYQEIDCSGLFVNSDKGKGWIKVIFFDHSAIISPTGIRSKNNRKIWVQNIQTGESVWPHDLIQAMGEGIEIRYIKE